MSLAQAPGKPQGEGIIASTTQHPVVALTFDDLPAAGQRPADQTRLQIVQSIVGTLKAEHVPPVYGFVNGVRVAEDPIDLEVLRAWRAAGESLGSHTYSHPDLDAVDAGKFEADVAKNEPLLAQVAGDTDWHWFRYPFLHEGDTLEKDKIVADYLKQHGYRTAEVSLDFEDYLWNAPYARCEAKHDDAHIAALHDSYLAIADEYLDEFRGLTRRLYGREIPYVLLLHAGAFDARMLPDLIALLRARGFSFITLPEALSDPAYTTAVPFGYPGGGALQELEAARRKVPFPPNAKPYSELEKMCSH